MAKTRDYMDYLDDNIEIAPANSQEEYQAAETIANVLGDHELETTIEEFDTHPMAGMVIPVLTCLLFVCLLVAGLTQDTVHILFVLLSACLVAVPLYVHFMSPDLFDRFGPASQSQNVVALHRATGDKVVKGARPIVVVAHYDTPRESLLRKGPLARYQAMLRVASIPCTIAVAVSLLIQIMLFLPQVIRTFMWVIGLMALVPLLVLAVVDIIDHFAVCTTGANDNKSSIAALLAIADKVRPMADRVDEDFEARDPQPHRRRSTDPVPEPPAPRRVEVLEEVKGVRHGADVLNALGILPSTCEVIYQEPRVQVVEEPGAFEADDVAPELPPATDQVEQPDYEPAPEESSDEQYSEDAYEEDYDEEGAYADEADRYEEDYDEEGAYADEDKFADEESDESAESEDEGDSYDETFEGEAYEGEFGEDEESEDYDEEFDEDEEYDEFAEEDYDEEWSESEGAGSVGSWFSERIQDIREFFSKTRGSDIDIDRGEDRRTDEERDEYDEWIDEYSSTPKKRTSDEDESDELAETAYEEKDEATVADEGAEPDAEVEADANEGAESDEYEAEEDIESDDYDSAGDDESEPETSDDTDDLEDEGAEDYQESEDVVVEERPRRAFPNLPHIADGEDDEFDEDAEQDQQSDLDEEDYFDNDDEFDDFEYDEEELESEEESEYDEEDEGDVDDEYEDVAAAPMGIGARIARFFRRLRINPAHAEIDPYEEQQRYYEEGYEDEYEEYEEYEEEEYEYEDEPEETYEPEEEYEDDEFAGSYDEDDLYEPSDFEDEFEDDFEDDYEDDFEDDDFEEDDFEPYEELEENPYGETDEDLDDDSHDEVAYIEEDADAEDDEFIEYEEIVEYYEDEDEFDEYEVAEEEVVEEEAATEDDLEDEPYDDGDFDGNPYYDGFIDADLEFEDELEDSEEQAEEDSEPLSDPNVLHFDREEDDDIVPRDTTGLDTISDSYDLYTGEVNRVADRELPEPLDDPNWGVSSYRPARPVMNIARRAALFDLPDPSAGSVDPFENDYDDYEEYEDDVDGYDDELDEAEASDTYYDEPYNEPYDEPYEEDVAPEPADDAAEDEPADAPAQRDVENTLERKGFWNEGRSSNWKGGATVRSDLRDMEDDPLVIDADDLQDAILEFGDDFLIGHDIWFVATGASETGHAGIKAFIDAHRRDIRGSFLINLDSIGAGTLSLLVREGLHAQRRADRRLVRMVSDIAKDLHIKLDSAVYTFDERESATSMRSRVRSVTIAGLDENDLPALSHTPSDVPENVDPKQVHDVVRIVTELIRRS